MHPLTQGAQPIRLTTHEAHEGSPDFSPDGGLIAFRSERDSGGIYIVPTLGGEERLLVSGGDFPRFSPDGQTVAYCVGGNYEVNSAIWVIPVAGGIPRRLAADVPWACWPVFTTDGRHILFNGSRGANDPSHDWWVTPLDGGPSVKTDAATVLARQMKTGTLNTTVSLTHSKCLFALGGRIWELDLAGPDWTAKGPARPLTSGGLHQLVRVASVSRFVFANLRFATHLWTLALDHNSGKALGELEPLPHSGGSQQAPTASGDGHLLAYTQTEPAGASVRIRDSRTSRETTLLHFQARPKVSPDGTRLAYSVFPDSISVMSTSGGESTALISKKDGLSTQIVGWTPDSRKIVHWFGEPIRYALLDPDSRQSTVFLQHPRSTPLKSPPISVGWRSTSAMTAKVPPSSPRFAMERRPTRRTGSGSVRPSRNGHGGPLTAISFIWLAGEMATDVFGRSPSTLSPSTPRVTPSPFNTFTELDFQCRRALSARRFFPVV